MTRAGGVTLDLSPARFRVVRPGHCRPASSGVWTDLGDMTIPDPRPYNIVEGLRIES